MDSDCILLKVKDSFENRSGVLIGTVFFVIVIITSYDNVWLNSISFVAVGVVLLSLTIPHALLGILSRRKSGGFNLIDIVLTLFLVYSLSYLFKSFTVEYATYNARWLLIYSTAYFLGRLIRTQNKRNQFFIAVFLVAVYQSLVGMAQLNMVQILENGLSSINPNQIKGNFSNSSTLACLASTGILLGITFLKKKNSVYLNILTILSLLLLAIILFFTTSRAAILMLLLGILILLRVKWKYVILLGSLLIALFFTFKKESIHGRLFVWKVSVEIIKENPFFGVGANRFGAVYNNYQGMYFKREKSQQKEAQISGNNFFAFNLPLKIFVEYGIIGFILFLFILFWIFLSIRRNLQLFSLLTGFFVFSLFSYPLNQLEISFLFFVLIGSASSLNCGKRYSLNIRIFRITGIAACIILCFVLLNEITVLNILREWERQKALQTKAPEKYIFKLHKFNDTLKGFPEFIFHYGAILVQNGQMEAAIRPLELCSNRLPSSNLYIYLGISYESINERERALKNYEFATKVVPNLFVPKYYLFLCYKRGENHVLARKIALEILNQPVKVRNSKITDIKKDVFKYLEEVY